MLTQEGWHLVWEANWYKCTTIGHRKEASLEGIAYQKRRFLYKEDGCTHNYHPHPHLPKVNDN
jgi:hypothetical protein